MKKRILLFILPLIAGYLLQAQNNLISSTCFGGSGNDGANNIKLTADGGYIFAGYTNSSDGNVSGYHGDNIHNEIWVVKADSNANIQWQKCLGGTGGELVNQVLITNDGGYLVVGSTQSTNGDVTQHFGGSDAWIVKLDNSGALSWQRSYGGSGNDYAYGAAVNALGHYVIAGTTNSTDSGISVAGGYDGWELEIDSAGNLLQQHTYGGAGNDALYNVLIVDSSGNYYLTGNTTSSDNNIINHGGWDIWTLETDGANVLQQACFGGDSDEYFYNSIIDSSGTIVIVGGTYSYNNGDVTGSYGAEDAWVLQVDTFFDLVSQAVVGGSDNDYFTGVADDGGQLLLTGTTYSNNGTFAGLNHGGADIFLVQMADYAGPVTAVNCYGGALDDFGNSICTQPVYYSYDAVVDSVDTVLIGATYNIYIGGTITAYNGAIAGSHGAQDAWVGKVAQTIDTATGIMQVNNSLLQPAIYPNPSTGNFVVQVSSTQTFTGTMELLNTLGETVSSQIITVNTGMNIYNSPSNSAELAKGIYLLRITDDAGNGVVRKVVIE